MILVIGPGAVGTVLAAHLTVSGREAVRLVVRDRHLEALSSVTHLRVDLPRRPGRLMVARPDLTVQLRLNDVDYVFICVKYPDLAPLLAAMPEIPPGCTIVSAMNGIAPLRLIRARFPQAQVAPMTVMFNGQLVGPLHARITTKPEILVGSADTRLLGSFDGSGMRSRRVEGEAAVWGKLLINLANALCGLTHSTFRDLLTVRDLRVAYVAVVDEAVTVLDQAGIAYELPVPLPYPAYRRFLLRGGPLPWWVSKVKNGLSDGAYPSMVADIGRGRRTEVDQLNGEIVELAQTYGGQAPVNAEVVRMIKEAQAASDWAPLSPDNLRARLGT